MHCFTVCPLFISGAVVSIEHIGSISVLAVYRVVCEFTWWLYIVVVELLSLMLVSVLWGCTNPLLKRGTEGIEHVTKPNRVSQLLAEVKFLFLNLKVNPRIKFECECVFLRKVILLTTLI